MLGYVSAHTFCSIEQIFWARHVEDTNDLSCCCSAEGCDPSGTPAATGASHRHRPAAGEHVRVYATGSMTGNGKRAEGHALMDIMLLRIEGQG